VTPDVDDEDLAALLAAIAADPSVRHAIEDFVEIVNKLLEEDEKGGRGRVCH
jgi:hypothetical protein